VSILTFTIIQIAAGDFMSSLAARSDSSGSSMDQATIDNMRHQYGLDRRPHPVSHVDRRFVQGDFGYSLIGSAGSGF